MWRYHRYLLFLLDSYAFGKKTVFNLLYLVSTSHNFYEEIGFTVLAAQFCLSEIPV
jgi:hypothetical protein